MGDRTSVTLTVLKEQYDEVSDIVEDADFTTDHEEDGIAFVNLEISEVNYGDLNELPDLIRHGIAYNYQWDAGAEFTNGHEFSRFTAEGDHILINLFDEEAGIALNALMPNIDDSAALRAVVIEHAKAQIPLPWDNQVEYGKIYRMKQAVKPIQ